MDERREPEPPQWMMDSAEEQFRDCHRFLFKFFDIPDRTGQDAGGYYTTLPHSLRQEDTRG